MGCEHKSLVTMDISLLIGGLFSPHFDLFRMYISLEIAYSPGKRLIRVRLQVYAFMFIVAVKVSMNLSNQSTLTALKDRLTRLVVFRPESSSWSSEPSFSGLSWQGIFSLTGSGCEKCGLGAVFPTPLHFHG